ncbi:hypothetical protein Dimus_013336 [Dionaea muscipula]
MEDTRCGDGCSAVGLSSEKCGAHELRSEKKREGISAPVPNSSFLCSALSSAIPGARACWELSPPWRWELGDAFILMLLLLFDLKKRRSSWSFNRELGNGEGAHGLGFHGDSHELGPRAWKRVSMAMVDS